MECCRPLCLLPEVAGRNGLFRLIARLALFSARFARHLRLVRRLGYPTAAHAHH
jgi:hypothetical protein